jgi:hypothetical protein
MMSGLTPTEVVDWMMLDDKEYACRKLDTSTAKERHFLKWNELPDDVPIDAIISLRLITSPDTLIALPTKLATLPKLENLSIPRLSVRMLRRGQIPTTVRLLTVSGGRTATWPPDVPMPNVEKLTSSEGLLSFDVNCFPHLEALVLKIGRNEAMVSTIAQYRSITSLRLITVAAPGIFSRVAELPLREFGLGASNVDSIEQIGRLEQLNEVYLHTLPKLESLKGLEELPELTTVTILYCKRIKDIERVLSWAKLRRLTVVGCGNIGLSRIRGKLDSMELTELMVGATT